MNKLTEDPLAKIPFSPERLPFFYGWLILPLGALGVLASMPGQTLGVAAFKGHMRDALGISDVAISTAYMIGTIMSSLLLTPTGRLLDRLGARIVAPIAALLMGVVAFLLARCDKIADFLSGDHLSPNASAMIVMILLFCLLRFFGQGVLTMSSRNMVVKWFDKRRGYATGLMGFMTQPGFAATPYFFYLLVDSFGWRHGWEILGAVVVFVFVPLAVLFFRDNPEACGLVPDGKNIIKKDGKRYIHKVYRQYSLPEARRTFIFWVFVGSVMLYALLMTAIGFHVESIFSSVGLTRSVAFASFVPSCIISMIMRPLFGKLSDVVRLKHILQIKLVGMILLMLGVAFLRPGVMLLFYYIGGGIASAIFALLLGIAWPTFFGREHLGAISGFGMSLIVFGSAIGPWFFSKMGEISGGYRLPSLISVGVLVCFFIASFFVHNPQESHAQ